MNLIFQLSLLALIALSLLIVVSVPVIFASPNGWNDNKNYVLLTSAVWAALVFVVGSLNSFVV
uniref:Photosystem II reaction center protein Z n=1 Tax=Phacus inflexus TaxID=461210 RepID=A0A3G3LKU3_9EUGL|nr:photosystem II protein Z [Phacus inflexus]AYQ93333.1 photosystem II protein Z [Phacus inflexus]